jgi:hypothetical protein
MFARAYIAVGVALVAIGTLSRNVERPADFGGKDSWLAGEERNAPDAVPRDAARYL